MKLKKSILHEIIAKATDLILEYEQYVDEDGNIHDDEGNVTRMGKDFGRQYGGDTYGSQAPWGRTGGLNQRSRKTSHVGMASNADKIMAIEDALSAKPNNFLTSILNQLKAGRGLSGKQRSIVKKIIRKHDPGAIALFENNTATNEQLLRKWVRASLLKTSI